MNIYDNLEVKKSTVVEGFGLFAKKKFIKGEVIYKKHYYKIPQKVVDILFSVNENEENLLIMEKLWGNGNDYYISLNIDQYINHSTNPNSLHGIALRDIELGEEIFEDYSSFDNEAWFQKLNKEMGIWSHIQ
jgi:SET domain-containing protein